MEQGAVGDISLERLLDRDDAADGLRQPTDDVLIERRDEARIDHRGRGAQADAQGIGWLGRFFLNVLPF
mgnify:CR=1 FL=1